jgi:murein L,D-transpeptidase YafK
MWMLLWFGLQAPSPPPSCVREDVHVVVDTTAKQMILCSGHTEAARHAVNLGKGGLGKHKQGDDKTPLGTYALQPPRASNSGFTWFVPVGYPTKEQAARGFTGGAIGIHGPPEYIPQLIVDVAFDSPWTNGCIMVRTKEEIEAVRAWMLTHKPTVVVIQGAPIDL